MSETMPLSNDAYEIRAFFRSDSVATVKGTIDEKEVKTVKNDKAYNDIIAEIYAIKPKFIVAKIPSSEMFFKVARKFLEFNAIKNQNLRIMKNVNKNNEEYSYFELTMEIENYPPLEKMLFVKRSLITMNK